MGVSKIHPSTRSNPQARSVQTRAGILRAAERIFAESGLAGARTDAIAEAAGVNKALLYYYFKSKESLYAAVIEDHFREFNERAMQTLNSSGSARAILLRYVSVHFDFISSRRRHASLYQQMMMNGGKSLQRIVQKYFVPRSRALDELLKRGMRDGEFRRTDRRNAAISIVGLIVFYFSAARVMQLLGFSDVFSEAMLHRRKREVLDFVRYGLFVNPKGRLK
ncbi:MAG TPA: TetR/AcrR family transcriptional regulator [Tepidisphaeraceae bacterium]|nr:TetR/AcrR family transcriptional regulator [Tepidisphaeraceae bacterium]